MPVWRMEDDCLAPNARLKIEYKGQNPLQVYRKASSIMRETLQIGAWERDFRWDISGDPRDFFVRVYGRKPLDSRSYVLVEIILQGRQPSNENENGNVTILINGRLVTEYNLRSWLQRTNIYQALLRLYNLVFYWNMRRRYLDMCSTFLNEIYNRFKTVLNIK